MIPSHDFGGHGPPLHFAHANGFAPGSYAPLIETLTARFHVQAMLLRPLWPDGAGGLTPARLRSWQPFVDDLIAFMDERGARGWVGVGHSIGALATVAAALRRPELFRAVVAIEPVILMPPRRWAWRLAQRVGLAGRLHPLVRDTRRRRRVFASRDEMYARYRAAPTLRAIDDHGLRTYVEAAARPRPDGTVELAYAPEWEARVYEVGPLEVLPRLGRLRPPLLVLRGARSDAFDPSALAVIRRRLPSAAVHEVPGAGHLLPLEQPAAVGQLINEFLAE